MPAVLLIQPHCNCSISFDFRITEVKFLPWKSPKWENINTYNLDLLATSTPLIVIRFINQCQRHHLYQRFATLSVLTENRSLKMMWRLLFTYKMACPGSLVCVTGCQPTHNWNEDCSNNKHVTWTRQVNFTPATSVYTTMSVSFTLTNPGLDKSSWSEAFSCRPKPLLFSGGTVQSIFERIVDNDVVFCHWLVYLSLKPNISLLFTPLFSTWINITF